MPAPPDTVAKRCVVFFGGYEDASASQQFHRFTREIGRFEKTWNIKTRAGDPAVDHYRDVQLWPVEAEGPNWHVDVRFHYNSWNDLIEEDFARPDWRAIPIGVTALIDFVITGTALRYLIYAWRYWLFSFYPFALSILFAVASAYAVKGIAGLGLPMPWFVAMPLVVAIFWVLSHWPGDKLRYRYMLNDWSFASAIAWGRRRSYRDKIESFADAMVKIVRDTDADEVLIVGHSLGAVLAVETLAAALKRDTAVVKPAPPVTLMTVGSSLLKVALHPGARHLRQSISRVLETGDVAWIDYSALVDPLNFYRADPARVLGLKASRAPVMRTAKIRAMLGPEGYQRFKRNFLRLHRQFVMGNGARYHYDFFMACCGPMPQAARIADMTASVDSFAEDGSYRPDGTAVPAQDPNTP
jgi:pimeloyl-ACP methyl ester carboxylesterase